MNSGCLGWGLIFNLSITSLAPGNICVKKKKTKHKCPKESTKPQTSNVAMGSFSICKQMEMMGHVWLLFYREDEGGRAREGFEELRTCCELGDLWPHGHRD